MQIRIQSDGEFIATLKDYKQIRDVAELAQFIAELEVIKKELLIMYEKLSSSSS